MCWWTSARRPCRPTSSMAITARIHSFASTSRTGSTASGKPRISVSPNCAQSWATGAEPEGCRGGAGRQAPARRAAASATLPAPSLQVNDVSHSDFSTLPLPAPLLDSIQQLGYQQMTPIQRAALPVILGGEDLIARARTGSGKTAAFGIGLLAPLNPAFLGCQALVLSPTRELAGQTAD